MQLRYNKHFNTSFASRFIVLWYHSINTNYIAAEQDAYLLNDLTKSPGTFWKPEVINSFSFKKLPAVQFELQFGFAALISHRFVDYRSVNIYAGTVIDITKFGKRC